jgi:hypothetical protein
MTINKSFDYHLNNKIIGEPVNIQLMDNNLSKNNTNRTCSISLGCCC